MLGRIASRSIFAKSVGEDVRLEAELNHGTCGLGFGTNSAVGAVHVEEENGYDVEHQRR